MLPIRAIFCLIATKTAGHLNNKILYCSLTFYHADLYVARLIGTNRDLINLFFRSEESVASCPAQRILRFQSTWSWHYESCECGVGANRSARAERGRFSSCRPLTWESADKGASLGCMYAEHLRRLSLYISPTGERCIFIVSFAFKNSSTKSRRLSDISRKSPGLQNSSKSSLSYAKSISCLHSELLHADDGVAAKS